MPAIAPSRALPAERLPAATSYSPRSPASTGHRWPEPLVGGDAAVSEAIGDRRVRITGLRDPDEVGPGGVRARGGDGPPLDVARELVGGGLVDAGAGLVVVDRRDLRRRCQTGDFGGNRR